MKEEILQELGKPFKLKARKGVGGKTFYYVSSDDIVERMNNVFKGNWNTEVLSVTEREGHVLAHVRVSVLDSDTGTMFYHEGFAGHYIARYTDGPRRGQIIDIGNSYRAAISKAIKVACSKWGVGLRLDQDLSDTEHDKPIVPEIVTKQAQTNVKPPQSAQTQNDYPFDIPNFNENINVSQQPTTETKAESPIPVDLTPETPVVPVSNSVPSEASPAVSVLPDIPENVSSSFDIPAETEPALLTPVQETAIKILIEQYGLSYEELAKQALGRDNFPPLNELDYKDAVKILQYGNNLK